MPGKQQYKGGYPIKRYRQKKNKEKKEGDLEDIRRQPRHQGHQQARRRGLSLPGKTIVETYMFYPIKKELYRKKQRQKVRGS